MIIVFLLSGVPLYFSVKILGGKTTLIKTAFIVLVSGILLTLINIFFIWGGIIGFIVLIWIYHAAFQLKWWKALLAWLLQFVVLAVFYFLLALIAGSAFAAALAL